MYKHKRIISILLFILSWSYLLYKLCTYQDYNLLFSNLKSLQWSNYLYLLAILLLMPLNLWFEIRKWHICVNKLEQQSFLASFRQVILGNAAAFITPYRLGEHPSRAYYLEDKDLFFSAMILGFIGAMALEFINVGIGLPAAVFYFNNSQVNIIWFVYGLILALLLVLFLMLPKFGRLLAEHKNSQQVKQVVNMLSMLTKRFQLRLILLSLLRYAVYSLQLYLALRFFNIHLTLLQALVAIPTYYMLVSVTPSLPIADAAIRGSWSVVVFQAYTYDTPTIAFAAVLLWLINTALPLIAVPFVKKQ